MNPLFSNFCYLCDFVATLLKCRHTNAVSQGVGLMVTKASWDP